MLHFLEKVRLEMSHFLADIFVVDRWVKEFNGHSFRDTRCAILCGRPRTLLYFRSSLTINKWLYPMKGALSAYKDIILLLYVKNKLTQFFVCCKSYDLGTVEGVEMFPLVPADAPLRLRGFVLTCSLFSTKFLIIFLHLNHFPPNFSWLNVHDEQLFKFIMDTTT